MDTDVIAVRVGGWRRHLTHTLSKTPHHDGVKTLKRGNTPNPPFFLVKRSTPPISPKRPTSINPAVNMPHNKHECVVITCGVDGGIGGPRACRCIRRCKTFDEEKRGLSVFLFFNVFSCHRNEAFRQSVTPPPPPPPTLQPHPY